MHNGDARIEYIPSKKVDRNLGLSPMQLSVLFGPRTKHIMLSNLHKTSDRSGPDILRLAIALARCLGSDAVTLHDAASVNCQGGGFMSLAWLNMLQGKPTYYEKFGFKHDDLERNRRCRKLVEQVGRLPLRRVVTHLATYLRILKRVEKMPTRFGMRQSNDGWHKTWSVNPDENRLQAKHTIPVVTTLLAGLTKQASRNQTFASRVGDLSRSKECKYVSEILNARLYEVQDMVTKRVFTELPGMGEFYTMYSTSMTKRL